MTWTGDIKLVKGALDEWDVCESKEADTPGMTDEYDVQSFLNADFMSKEFAAKYRRTAAKLNYLALDNPMIAFAYKEASRTMSSPKQGEEVKLKRILRPTTTYRFEWQDYPGVLTGYTDSDWAGCKLHPEIHQWRSHFARFAPSAPLLTDSSWCGPFEC